MGWGGGLAEGPTWENPWSLKGWGLAPTDRPGAGIEAGGGVGRRLTIGRSIVAADICGLVTVGGHHPIVVLVWAVDAHLGSPAWSAAGELGLAFVPSPPTPGSGPSGPTEPPHQVYKWVPRYQQAPEERPYLPTRPLSSNTSAPPSSSQRCHFTALASYLAFP